MSAKAAERTTQKVPKNSKDLARFRVQGAGPISASAKLVDWLDSSYVHGYGVDGTFALDDVRAGSITGVRLIGFHDMDKRHLGADYMNSWIVLPRVPALSLRKTWVSVSEMLNRRVIASDDSHRTKLSRGRGDISKV